jgi:uncharacterized protein (TIGR03067 family)
MRWSAALIVGLTVAAATGADDPPAELKREFQRFQGTWTVESWEEGGKALPAGDLKARGVFFGANAFIIRRDGKAAQAGIVQLDLDHEPHTFNAIVREGDGKDTVMLGVYAFDKDALTLAFDPKGRARPEGVKPDAESGATVVKLKRPPAPADEAVDIVGKFRSELDEPNGKKLVTEAVVERRGDTYLVTYSKDGKLLFVGTALRRGDQLSMAWVSSGQVGVSVYKIEKGPKLIGDYATLAGLGVTGREVLTKWREVD